MNNRELSYLSLGASFLAMLGTAFGAYYSSEQSEAAKNSYIAALEQLNIQKNELLLAKDTYATSLEQLHLYKEEVALAKTSYESSLEQLNPYKALKHRSGLRPSLDSQSCAMNREKLC
ncbi:hypothetical protein N7931_17530 [Catenovulum sp. 2E275]|uniref:hypothetical protein n=1 Tax=Catenovulum sp. 2E275 TaxID=2980497 RepID=UPI0021D12158|nr:hypothetical protein [Catenovulum sp. 2E275]MCU4677428.1 hypothetical protein [Catenovulum sp. 2E275]